MDIWKEHYCRGEYTSCARFTQAKTGRQIPLTLLPNGKIIEECANDTLCGSTAIFNAIVKKRDRMVRSLVKVGVDINARNVDGMTPLMAAAEFGSLEIARILLDNGADIDVENMYGHTALEIAEQKGHGEIAALLRRRSGIPELKTGT